VISIEAHLAEVKEAVWQEAFPVFDGSIGHKFAIRTDGSVAFSFESVSSTLPFTCILLLFGNLRNLMLMEADLDAVWRKRKGLKLLLLLRDESNNGRLPTFWRKNLIVWVLNL
jgi:hypothetical protein